LFAIVFRVFSPTIHVSLLACRSHGLFRTRGQLISQNF
jgi:hypothetical protein